VRESAIYKNKKIDKKISLFQGFQEFFLYSTVKDPDFTEGRRKKVKFLSAGNCADF
jgi:hypothetical protein